MERRRAKMPLMEVDGAILKDINDYEKAGMPGVALEALRPKTALDQLDSMELSMEQAEALSDSNFVDPNLIIEGHIVAICARPGGGKTTILFDRSRAMTAAGYSVYYIHADVGPGEAKGMLAVASEARFRYITPDLHPDGAKDISYVLGLFREMVEKSTTLNGVVFIVDTLKKIADMMSKSSLKELLKLCRSLTGLGATVVLLCHTNKHLDAERNYVFEGVGDLRADVDELIYLIPKANDDGSLTVSTKPDKVRGIFTPITFNISASRKVSMADNYVDTGAQAKADLHWGKDEKIVGVIIKALKAKKIKQFEICEWVREYWTNNFDEARPGEKRILAILKRYKYGARKQWHSRPGCQKNVIEYSLEPFVKVDI